MEVNNYIDFVRNHKYMSGIDRDTHRIKQTAEVFTPTELVLEILEEIFIARPELFLNPHETFLDNCCGDGQFLSEIVIKKMMTNGCNLETELSTVYGVDIMFENVEICKKRLAGPNPTPEILEILERNIVCHDALTYDYTFEPIKKKVNTKGQFEMSLE